MIKNDKVSHNAFLTGYTISGVELNNNVININRLRRATSFVILLLFFTLKLFLSMHKNSNLANILGAVASPPPGFYGSATTSKSFEYGTKILGIIPTDNSRLNAEVVVPLKCLSKFWRSLDLLLINSEIELELRWTRTCMMS